MPFERIKPPKLHAVIGTLIGVAIGVIIAKGNKAVLESTNQLNKGGCPDEKGVAKLAAKQAALGGLSSNLAASLGAFKALPPAILGPVAALEIAIEIILMIPLPQAIGIPPGPAGGLLIGLPVNTTTKFADTLNILKEFAAAMKISAIAIQLCLKGADAAIGGIGARVKDLDAPIKACQIENQLKKSLTKKQAGMLGMLDADGEYITSTLGQKVLAKGNTDSAKKQVETILKSKGILTPVKGSADSVEDLKRRLNLPKSDSDAIQIPSAVRISKGVDANKIAVINRDRDLTLDETNSMLVNANDGIIDNDYDIYIVELDTFKQGGLSGRAKALAELDNALRQMNDKLAISSGLDSGEELGEWILKSGTGENGSPTKPPPNPISPFTNIDGSVWIWNNGSVIEGLGLTTTELTDLKEGLESLSKGLQTKTDKPSETDPEYTYKGYELRIVKDPFSPPLAPKNFAIATIDDIQQLRGPSSFSSNLQVLLDEIKIRIDDQIEERAKIQAAEQAMLDAAAAGPSPKRPSTLKGINKAGKELGIGMPATGIIRPLNPSKALPSKEQLEGLTGGKNRRLPPDLPPGGGEYGGPRRAIPVDPRQTGNELMPKPTNMGMPPKRDLRFTQRPGGLPPKDIRKQEITTGTKRSPAVKKVEKEKQIREHNDKADKRGTRPDLSEQKDSKRETTQKKFKQPK